jgi:hypothetical protein
MKTSVILSTAALAAMFSALPGVSFAPAAKAAPAGGFMDAPVFAAPQDTRAAAPQPYVPSEAEKAAWKRLLAQGVERVVFVKRNTYNSNHYYTEFLNSKWQPGGNLYILDLKNSTTTELVPSLNGGVFGAFDVSFDASRIVFAYKAHLGIGYRLYEVNTDGTGLRSVTKSPDDEAEVIKRYAIPDGHLRAVYHHGTEDLDPCYLADGDIAFISTRCHFGVLCDGPDIFPTTTLHRISPDGKNLRRLSNSSLSENAPSLLPDGRILYTRWEYVDKGAVAVKCLWAMNPDGTGSVEIYGNDIAFPTTMIFGRAIPGSPNEYVFTGTPHYPQNCVGTVVRVDTTKDVRTRAPMTYMTPAVDIRDEGGFHFRDPANIPADPNAGWRRDRNGSGPLFRETFPLSRTEFLVSHKPAGQGWASPAGYQLHLLDETGKTMPVFHDEALSSFRPIPLAPRKAPPAIPDRADETLAAKGLAQCIVTDVYKGMENTPPGTIKYIRVLEQVPRPWGARRKYRGDEYDQQHATVTKDTHLGLKVQHGIVTVEADGSANFVVPAGRNIFLQALDANYRAVQTERTFVNYMAGEIRACVGCHESTSQAPGSAARVTSPAALRRPAETPRPQPGETAGQRTLSYARDVQPVWDKHCVSCHNDERQAGRLNLSGKHTAQFSVSYENLVPERRKGYLDRGLLGPVIGENHPKPGNIHYLPARSLGSHASILAAMFDPGIQLADEKARTKAERLAKLHKNIKPSPAELLRVTNWIDTNAQFYGSYYGRRHSRFRDRADYRPEVSFAEAIAPEAPEAIAKLNK